MKASIVEVAQAAGVSTATVSRVFSGKGFASQQAREAVLAAAKELGYDAPKPYRKQSHSAFCATVAVVVPDLCNQYFMEVIHGVEGVLNAHNVEVLICNTDESAAKEVRCLSNLRRIGVKGVIIAPVSSQEKYNAELLGEMQREGVPVVLLDRDIPGGALDGVFMENYRAAFDSVQTFLNCGHRHIAIICGPESSSSAAARLKGYCDALQQSGVPLRPAYILHGDFKPELAYALTRELMVPGCPVTAIFACNSRMSRGCMMALAESGLVLGRDVALISCGRVESGEDKVSCVVYPTQAIGEECASILLDRLSVRRNPRTPTKRVVFDMQLVLRGSERYPAGKDAPL